MAITIDAREGQIKDMLTAALTAQGDTVQTVFLGWVAADNSSETISSVSAIARVFSHAGKGHTDTELKLTTTQVEHLLKEEWKRQGYNIASIYFHSEDPPYWCAGCMGRGIVATATIVEPPPVNLHVSQSLSQSNHRKIVY